MAKSRITSCHFFLIVFLLLVSAVLWRCRYKYLAICGRRHNIGWFYDGHCCPAHVRLSFLVLVYVLTGFIGPAGILCLHAM